MAPITSDRTGFYNRKLYLKPGERVENRGNNQPLNHKLIRLGEVYLNYAEACAKTNAEGEARIYLKRSEKEQACPKSLLQANSCSKISSTKDVLNLVWKASVSSI